VGWQVGDGIFGTIIEVSLLISGLLLGLKHISKKYHKWSEIWTGWEDNVMKIAFAIWGPILLAN